MAKNIKLPPGFELDSTSLNSPSVDLPEGFELDSSQKTPPAENSSVLEKLGRLGTGYTLPFLKGIPQGLGNLAVGATQAVTDIIAPESKFAKNLSKEVTKLKQKQNELPTSEKVGVAVGETLPFLSTGAGTGAKIAQVTGSKLAGLGAASAIGSGAATLLSPQEESGLGNRIKESAKSSAVGGVFVLGVGAGASALSSTPGLIKKGFQKVIGITPKSQETLKAFDSAAINPTLANITQGGTTKTFQNLVANFPGGRGVIEKATQDQVDNIVKQIAGISKSEGGTIPQAGKTIQEGAQSLAAKLQARTSKLYDRLDQFVPKESPIIPPSKDKIRLYRGLGEKFNKDFPLASTDAPVGYSTWTDNPELAKQYAGKDGYVYQIDLPKRNLGEELIDDEGERVLFLNNEKAAGLRGVSGKEYLVYNDHDLYDPNLIKEFGSKPNKISTNNLQNITKDPYIQDVMAINNADTKRVVDHFNNLVDEEGNMSYNRLKIFRSTVGAKLQSPSLGGDERSALKKVYGALSEDMKQAVINSGGSKGLEAFERANKTFVRTQNILENKINPLIEAKTPVKVYNLVMSGTKQGGTDTRYIMKSLDQDQKAFVRGTVAREMGLANEGMQGAERSVFSPDKFLTEYNKMQKIGAEKDLFTPQQNEAFKELNKVFEAVKQTGKAKQTSNNLPYFVLGGLSMASLPGAAGSVVGANISAKMMTNPSFLRWLAKSPKIETKAIPSYIRQLSIIGSKNPEIREDILDYLGSITSDTETADLKGKSIEGTNTDLNKYPANPR